MERAKPATFADFMDGLSRAMGLPVAPAAPAHRVTLPAAPAPTRLQQAVAAYRKLLDNRLRDHDAEYRARCEIADAALAEAQEHGE